MEHDIETALKNLETAEANHAALVSSKCAALGITVGSYSKALETDAELAAAFEACRVAARAYSVACGE